MIIFPVHSCVQRRIIKALRHEGEDRVSQISSDEKTRMELKQHFLYLELARKRTNLSSMRQVFTKHERKRPNTTLQSNE